MRLFHRIHCPSCSIRQWPGAGDGERHRSEAQVLLTVRAPEEHGFQEPLVRAGEFETFGGFLREDVETA